jgi:hypothetical protein
MQALPEYMGIYVGTHFVLVVYQRRKIFIQLSGLLFLIKLSPCLPCRIMPWSGLIADYDSI